MSQRALLWILQRITAVVLTLGLGAHFYLMHFSGGELTYETILSRLSHPGWVAFNLIVLCSAIFHGMSGLWGIAIEHVQDPVALRITGRIIAALSLTLAVAGASVILQG